MRIPNRDTAAVQEATPIRLRNASIGSRVAAQKSADRLSDDCCDFRSQLSIRSSGARQRQALCAGAAQGKSRDGVFDIDVQWAPKDNRAAG